ncbi:hypothetical protein BJV78DRAFT_1177406 [Lactifluus subvellereus]|nr:hypothetical protein BJV78DRAFT_1177406 [Lactifluus subvellereus]
MTFYCSRRNALLFLSTQLNSSWLPPLLYDSLPVALMASSIYLFRTRLICQLSGLVDSSTTRGTYMHPVTEMATQAQNDHVCRTLQAFTCNLRWWFLTRYRRSPCYPGPGDIRRMDYRKRQGDFQVRRQPEALRTLKALLPPGRLSQRRI